MSLPASAARGLLGEDYRHAVRRALGLLAVVVACHGTAPGPADAIARRDALRTIRDAAAELPTRPRATLVVAAYDVLFAGEADVALATPSDRELVAWFDAVDIAAFHATDPRHARAEARVLAELARRGMATDAQYRKQYERHVAARLLVEARELARRWPEEPALPAVREASLTPGAPTVWRVAPDRRELVRESVALDRSAQVVIVSHPGCHFSQNAMLALDADPVLGPVLAAHAIRVAPQDGQLDLDELQRWNREHPRQPIALAYRREEWPMIAGWDTPTFYFLRGDALVATVVGWPRAGRRAEVLAALQQIGLAR